MGHNWKTLTTEQKTTYEAKAKSDKDRYEREKKAYAAKKEWLVLLFLKFTYYFSGYDLLGFNFIFLIK